MAYQGGPGRTQKQAIHYACPCGALFPTRVVASINTESDPELLAELLGGRLHRLRCPACGASAQAELPVVLHDPAAPLFALVLPDWARARELEERAALYARVAEDAEAIVPLYVREPFVVYGAAGVRALMTAERPAEAANATAGAGAGAGT